MSSDCSDDDMPELESVSSSEYMSDDEDCYLDDDLCPPPVVMPKWANFKAEHYKIAKKWLEQDRVSIDRQFNVIAVYLFSPFLYGHAHQSDIWLRWCQEAGLLISDTSYNTECLSDGERHSVDLLESALLYCRNTLKDRTSPNSLAFLLKLASDIQDRQERSYKHAVRKARRNRWFMFMMKDFKMNSTQSTVIGRYPLELGCLYVINQTAEHVFKFVKDGHDFYKEFQDKVQSDEEVGEQLKKSGDDLVKEKKHREAIEEYSTAIVCCPYNYKLYTNRALAYMELKEYKSALSDGLRAMILNPTFSKGYIRYIVGLKACGEMELMQRVSDEYHKKFPGPKDRDLLKKAIDLFPPRQVEKIEPSQEDRQAFETLNGKCRLASECYLSGNIKEAAFYFQEAVLSIRMHKGWRNCLPMVEWKKLAVSIHFGCGLALLESGSNLNAEMALKEFETILEQYASLRFVPAYWGAARALVMLHRHSRALLTARNGLEQLPLVKLIPNFTWPGTTKVMSEALLQNIETNLQKIQKSCEPACVPDAICRYNNCMLHHKSSNIRIVSEDYKGHVLLVCTDSCSIAYHPTCWRRFKNESVIGSDRDFLLTSCPTPDCMGEVSSVSVFDLKGKCKIKFEPPAGKAPGLTELSSNQAKKKAKKGASKAKNEKISEKSLRKKLPSDSGASESSKHQDLLSKKISVDSVSPEGSVASDMGVARDSPPPVAEDVRKLEDRVNIINRQAEAEGTDAKEPIKAKTKKKKEKKTLTKDQLGFTLSDRLVRTDTSPEEEPKNKAKWTPDAESPFQPPEHLRKAIEQFETKEVPSMGLVPRPPPAVAPPTAASKKQSEDFEFIFSYFREVFKTHGGLHPSDPKLADALMILPQDKKGLIGDSGGLENFLLMSPLFKSHGELICLFEDASVIAASIDSMGGSSGSSGSGLSQGGPENEPIAGKNTKKKKSKAGKKSSQTQSQNSTDGELAKFDVNSVDGKTKIYGEELSSAVNSAANSPLLSPRIMSPVLSGKPKSRPSSASSAKDLTTGDGLKKSASGDSLKSASVDNLKSDPLPKPKSETIKAKVNGKDSVVDQDDKYDGIYEDMFGKRPVKRLTSRVNGLDKETSDEKLTTEWDRQFEKVQSELVTGGGRKGAWGEQKPVLPDNQVSVGVSARPLMTDNWAMTDPIPPVESFKERYEGVLKEKHDLHSKLERSEDQKFKMQRDHKRELDKVQKQSKADARGEYQSRIDDLEKRVADERDKVSVEKKDHSEQTRSLKTEIKSLSDKIDKMKKEASKKEKQSQNMLGHTRTELETSRGDIRKIEERLRVQNELVAKALRRAIEAELELLALRKETILRPGEMRLREVEGILMNLPKENEYWREWENYRDKLKTSLDCFVNAMEDQVKQVRGGRAMAQLDPVPNPAVPLPPQLATFRMPFLRAPFRPPTAMMIRPPGMPQPLPFDPGMPRPPEPGPSGMPLPPTGPNPPGALTQPAAVGSSGFLPPGGQQNVFNDHSPLASLPTEIDPVGGAKKVSSFDRIVEKLTPTYPHFHKGDFKNVLREVRRNNGNTLSGLSLDNIASQIGAILDARTGRVTSSTTPTLTAGGVVSGKGKRSKGQKTKLPPVAVAEPPKMSDIEYDNDGWCIICYEDMTEEDSSTLNCGHRFHSDCIRSWFNEQSTCPTCRNHSLLPDEYPTLK